MDSKLPSAKITQDDIAAWDQLRSERGQAVSEAVVQATVSNALVRLDRLTQEDFAHDDQAFSVYQRSGCNSVIDAFTLANILHANSHLKEASRFYRTAFDLHSRNSEQHPLAQSLLQARLLCLLKADLDLPAHEVVELRSISVPHANFVESVYRAWRENDPAGAMSLIATAYEEFHTGEEIDVLYLSFAMSANYPFGRGAAESRAIPNKLSLYCDKDPAEEIQNHLDFHRKIAAFDVKIFDKPEAEQWLCDVYGVEARSLFLGARHPAEAANILRVHVIQALGGWWLDADMRIRNEDALQTMLGHTEENILFLNRNKSIHNGFFGSVQQSPLLSECLLNIYRNCYLHPGLFMDYKTGPGVFTRALNRQIHRDLTGTAKMRPVHIYDHDMFCKLIEETASP